ncbi:unnamed protein product [Didymodactylos carnosus]|uniref:Uncharacterized protein n=1 Tax=Didymodactylos carnosus TaxID=1234261 RepID=A0A814KRJ3_9BILA|nr:unnamed protein product [Didymodactylos carnosus]CAF1055954.1 unnamed protein product [Didymodactylos carnosus]CAF3559822.1 unnamed protein product [Didymodactylos carnosus]CAF3824956.1 unnamed protein product [Didymodactylos carnosus]
MATTISSKPNMSTIRGHDFSIFLIDFILSIDSIDENVKQHCRRFHKLLTEEFDADEVQLGQSKVPKSYSVEHYADVYPLLLHVSSISAGIVFNYYYSYMIKQARTNNISLKFTLDHEVMNGTEPPRKIQIQLVTEIESFYMHQHEIPTDGNGNIQDPMKTAPNTLRSRKLDLHRVQIDGKKVVYAATSFDLPTRISDYGYKVRELYVWNQFSIAGIQTISLQDHVRKWNEEYSKKCKSDEIHVEAVYMTEKDKSKICLLVAKDFKLNVDDMSRHVEDDGGKKTQHDCYKQFISDPNNLVTKCGKQISKVLYSPVYYIIAPSSCYCGEPDSVKLKEEDKDNVKGIINDPDKPGRIQLAYANCEVLRSREMEHFNRYLRRTFYYVDEENEKGEIVRVSIVAGGLWDQIKDDILSWYTHTTPSDMQTTKSAEEDVTAVKVVPIKRLFKLGTAELEQTRLFIERSTWPQRGNFKDVIIMLNGGLSNVSTRLLSSIPYLMFDLNMQNEPNDADIVKIVYYLKNLNIMSKSYTEHFESIEELMQEKEVEFTTAGKGIAAAFYFNYVKLLVQTEDHRKRVQTLKEELNSLNVTNKDNIFIEKWVFVLPWTTNGAKQLLETNQYEDIQAEFHFGKFDPTKQAQIFQKEVQHYFDQETNTNWHKHIILLPLSIPDNDLEKDHTSKALLEILWSKLNASS